MQDLSLHILDIVENSIKAKATLVQISITEDIPHNKLIIVIKDNGSGISAEQPSMVLDPFYSTKNSSRIGLGLPLLQQATQEAGGDLKMQSDKHSGTTITANFIRDHIDRKPLGNVGETLIALIASKGEEMDFVYTHQIGDQIFEFDTREIKLQLENVTINNPEIINYLKKVISDNLTKMNIGR
ncbi:MAG: histidine kinase [Desulfuromonas sp. SDB]|nr:MAG: histidine kinase [Desulfuromonas sp. SDB]